MSDKPIKLYALSTCGHCRNAKKLLNDCEVEFDVVEVDLTQGEERAQLIDEVKKYNPSCTFPTLIIGDKVIVGYREADIRKALGI